MAFGNVILPETTTADLKGLFLLLDLLVNPARAADAQKLLSDLSALRDEAQTKFDTAQAAQRDADAKATANVVRARELDQLALDLTRAKADAAAVKADYQKRIDTMQEWLAKGGR